LLGADEGAAIPYRQRLALAIGTTALVGALYSATLFHGAAPVEPVVLSSVDPDKGRVFLHIADTHADPFYDYTQFLQAAPAMCRHPSLYDNKVPASACGDFSDSVASILAHWNATGAEAMGRGGGPACPCGHFSTNPPYAVLASLKPAIASHDPEFVLWSGDFASHYEPGTNKDTTCATAKNSAKATVTMVNAKFGTRHGKPIQHLWAWGNNDVLPKRQPLKQEWLEDFGAYLVQEGWLLPEEFEGPWKLGGFYKRRLGGGLCALMLNSNSWTKNQINKVHHDNQLKWLEGAFHDPECSEYLINAHVPLGWLEQSRGHHNWTNLEGAVHSDYARPYRDICDRHAKKIVAELYGHINKAALRLNDKGKDAEGHEVEDVEPVSSQGKSVGDLDEDVGGDAKIISFTVAGISRRGLNDPQYQKITLEKDVKRGIEDISVYSMKRQACGDQAFTFAYSFRELFEPDFDDGINVESVERFVENDKQRERVEQHIALTSMPYEKTTLKDQAFLDAVRAGTSGC